MHTLWNYKNHSSHSAECNPQLLRWLFCQGITISNNFLGVYIYKFLIIRVIQNSLLPHLIISFFLNRTLPFNYLICVVNQVYICRKNVQHGHYRVQKSISFAIFPCNIAILRTSLRARRDRITEQLVPRGSGLVDPAKELRWRLDFPVFIQRLTLIKCTHSLYRTEVTFPVIPFYYNCKHWSYGVIVIVYQILI